MEFLLTLESTPGPELPGLLGKFSANRRQPEVLGLLFRAGLLCCGKSENVETGWTFARVIKDSSDLFGFPISKRLELVTNLAVGVR